MAIRTLEPETITGPAPIGHNHPPLAEPVPLAELIPLEFRLVLLRDRQDFFTKVDLLVDAADRAHADDDESLGRCGDLVNQYRKANSHVDATHKEVKEPHLIAGRLVDAEKNAIVGRIAIAKAKVESIANAFVAKREAAVKAERDRIAAEQRAAAERAMQAQREQMRAEADAARAVRDAATAEERIAAQGRADEAARLAERAMADAALAPAIQARSEPVRSDEGATVSGKQEWQSQVIDYQVAIFAVIDNAKVQEAIDKAIAALVRAGKREIEGVRIWPVAKASFR